MSRLTASDRLRRILAMVPWIVERDGPTVDEICQRFDVTRPQLLEDLEVLFMVGIYPYTPDELIDVRIEDDRVWIDLADFFRRPLRLSHAQGLALVAAGSSLLAVQGADESGPLARGLAKLAAALGVNPDDVVEVHLGPAETRTLALLTEAALAGHRVEIDYYGYGRDERSRRIIEPHRVYADSGQWYVAAYCLRAEGDRVFRLDRISEARRLEERFEVVAEPLQLGVFRPEEKDPRVELDLEPGARWVIEQYPCESVVELGGGRIRVTLAVSARPWLERLLLRLGRDANLVSCTGDQALLGARREAAQRILDRYENRYAEPA
ncbi:MAG: Protein PafC [Acidimicrobiales bacterium]|nr:Protein PafC [Acidimicrobiales bacterium]